MATRHPLQASFARGVLGKKLHARSDLDHYRLALKDALNFEIARHGGARRRAGSRYVHPGRADNDSSLLIEFVFDSDEAYIIEMSKTAAGGAFRFFALNGYVAEPGDPSTPYEVAHPYTEAQLGEVDWAGTFDTMYFAHEDMPPMQLVRRAETDWSLEPYPFKYGPYGPINVTATTLAISGTAVGNQVVTFSSIIGINDDNGFDASDNGRWITVLSGTVWRHCQIVSVVTDRQVNVVILPGDAWTDPNYTTNANWRLGLWCPRLGYPGKVALFLERVAWAAQRDKPTTIWMTRSGTLDSFRTAEPLLDTDALSFTLSGASPIVWIAEADDLIYGTSKEMRALGPAERGLGFSAVNVAHRKGRRLGVAAGVRPIVSGGELIFSNLFATQLRATTYSYESDAYKAPEITVLSDDLYTAGVAQNAGIAEPDNMVLTRLTDGNLVAMSYEADEQLVACMPWQLGGTDVEVLQIAAIPGAEAPQFWAIVKRTINGATVRYIEVFEPAFNHADQTLTAPDGWFVDCGLQYEGTATDALAGFDHLAGETVSIMTNKGKHRQRTVGLDGTIELDFEVTQATIGLGAQAFIRSLEIPQQEDGSLKARKRILTGMVIDVLTSGYMEIGQEGLTAENPYTRLASDLMDKAPALRTGAFHVPLESGWDKAGELIVTVPADSPTPAFIRAIVPQYEAEP